MTWVEKLKVRLTTYLKFTERWSSTSTSRYSMWLKKRLNQLFLVTSEYKQF